MGGTKENQKATRKHHKHQKLPTITRQEYNERNAKHYAKHYELNYEPALHTELKTQLLPFAVSVGIQKKMYVGEWKTC